MKLSQTGEDRGRHLALNNLLVGSVQKLFQPLKIISQYIEDRSLLMMIV